MDHKELLKHASSFIVTYRYALLIILITTLMLVNFFDIRYSLERIIIDLMAIAIFLIVTFYCALANKKMMDAETEAQTGSQPLPHENENPLTVTAEYSAVEETLHTHPEMFHQPEHAYDGKDKLELPENEEDLDADNV